MARAGKDSRVVDVDAALEAAGYQAPPSVELEDIELVDVGVDVEEPPHDAVKPAKRTAVPPKKSTRERPDPG